MRIVEQHDHRGLRCEVGQARRRGPEAGERVEAHARARSRGPRRRCAAAPPGRRDTHRTAASRPPQEVRGSGARTPLTRRRTTRTHRAGRPAPRGRSSCVDCVPRTRARAGSSRFPGSARSRTTRNSPATARRRSLLELCQLGCPADQPCFPRHRSIMNLVASRHSRARPLANNLFSTASDWRADWRAPSRDTPQIALLSQNSPWRRKVPKPRAQVRFLSGAL